MSHSFDGTIHTQGWHGTNFPRRHPRAQAFTDNEIRTLRLIVWAAKCHTHSQTTRMPLGNLPHSVDEVNRAIAAVEEIVGHPGHHEDEGVKVRSKRV